VITNAYGQTPSSLQPTTSPKYNLTVVKGDMLYLARTKPSRETISQESASEIPYNTYVLELGLRY
jgi:hypothetical protein